MPIIVCSSCRKEAKHYGKGLCKNCYMDEYRKIPEHKKNHAECERKRRAKLGDIYRKKDRERRSSEEAKNRIRISNQINYKNNRDKLIAYQKEYRKKNREKVNIADRKRKAILREDAKNFSMRDWHNILEHYEWKCFYCHRELDNPERDHKNPLTRGGKATIDNIVPVCHSCNCRKNDRTVDEYRDYLLAIGEHPLF